MGGESGLHDFVIIILKEIACVNTLRQSPVLDRLRDAGRKLISGLKSTFEEKCFLGGM